MSKVRYEWSYNNIGAELLRSQWTESVLDESVALVMSRLDGNYESDKINAGTRLIASVYTTDPLDLLDNFANNTLLKAIGG